MSATLYREGEDLDALLSELDSEHPGRVRVVEVSYPRAGGVGGFFARQRVGVEYMLEDTTAAPAAPRPRPAPVPPALANGFDDLIAAAEAAEDAKSRRRTLTNEPVITFPSTTRAGGSGGPDLEQVRAQATSNAEFARLVLEMAARKSAARASSLVGAGAPTETEPYTPAVTQRYETPWEAPVTAAAEPRRDVVNPAAPAPALGGPTRFEPLPPVVAPAPVVQAPPTTPVPAREPTSPASGRDPQLPLRRKLAELGVPVAWVPEEAPHPYAVIEQLVGQLPTADPVPTGDGQIVVVAGPARQLQASVNHLAAKLRLRPQNLWTTQAGSGGNVIADPRHAAAVAAGIKQTKAGAALIAVATDELADDGAADLSDLVTALRADALWVHVDASRKSTDTRAHLKRLGGRPSALVVTAAGATSSPATVWELGVPVALLDGRPASASEWAVLLLDKLKGLED